MYTCIYIYILHIYIYTYIERERERERYTNVYVSLPMCSLSWPIYVLPSRSQCTYEEKVP